jgi:hypothetical protein
MARSIVCVNELRIAIDGRERTRDNDEHIIGESDQGQTAQSEAKAGASRPDGRGRGGVGANRPLRRRGGTRL